MTGASTSPVVVVFGAGTGTGLSIARRFGRGGYRAALVGRRADRLDGLVETLGAEGITAQAFPADLSDPDSVPALVERIRTRMGRIDVVEYGPVGAGQAFTPAAELTAAGVRDLIGVFLLTPVEIAHAVLPELRERGGAFLITHGITAVQPIPGMSGLGPVMAAARNWALTLAGELHDSGVHVGTIAVGASIERSEMAERSGAASAGFPTIDPDEIADAYWAMVTDRDRTELVLGTTD
jgi:NAD(P)-dependent dehydrogenase (short-subunit alcohol dehydrogenase family)